MEDQISIEERPSVPSDALVTRGSKYDGVWNRICQLEPGSTLVVRCESPGLIDRVRTSVMVRIARSRRLFGQDGPTKSIITRKIDDQTFMAVRVDRADEHVVES